MSNAADTNSKVPPQSLRLWGTVALAMLAVLLRLYYWRYTHRTWEDSLIAYRHVVHLFQGHGLNYGFDPAAPVQGFTSPLGVLIPVIGELLHVGWGLPLLKLVSVLTAAATVLMLGALTAHRLIRLTTPLAFALMSYAAVEHHQILAGMGGMETQLVSLSLMITLYALVAERPRLLGLGIGFGLLARPDMALWALVAGGWLAFRGWRGLLPAVAIASLLYLPWLIFASAYYGSPIPNSMLAKQLNVPHWYEMIGNPSLRNYLRYGSAILFQDLLAGLTPSYAGHGTNSYFFLGKTGHSLVAGGLFVGALVGAITSFVRKTEFRPVALGLLVYVAYYLLVVPVMTFWYRATFSLLLLISAAYGIEFLFQTLRRPKRVLWAVASVFVLSYASVLPLTFSADRQIQQGIDQGVRQAAGTYLRDVLKPGETLACEPIGYVGYYSQAYLVDWPGIGSRAVTSFSREHRRSLEDIIQQFSPTYTLLRPTDLDRFADPGRFSGNYEEVAHFSVSFPNVERIRWSQYSVDKDYRIYRRKK